MKRINRIMPLFKKFIAIFIDDFIDALIGFVFGIFLEAIFKLEIIKAVIFIMIYFIISFVTNKIKEEQKTNKYQKSIINRGIKRKIIYIIGGIIITYIVLYYDISLLSFIMVAYLLKRLVCKKRKVNWRDINYQIKLNLINNFFNLNL